MPIAAHGWPHQRAPQDSHSACRSCVDGRPGPIRGLKGPFDAAEDARLKTSSKILPGIVSDTSRTVSPIKRSNDAEYQLGAFAGSKIDGCAW
jgi:hypothetical protein